MLDVDVTNNLIIKNTTLASMSAFKLIKMLGQNKLKINFNLIKILRKTNN